MEIVRRLMNHMDRAEGTMYRDELLQKIILICSQNNFQYITNFEWWDRDDILIVCYYDSTYSTVSDKKKFHLYT